MKERDQIAVALPPVRFTMPITKRVLKHASDLQYLARAKKAVRNRQIRQAPKDLIMALVDLAKAMIKGEISMSPKQLGSVRRQEGKLWRFVDPKTTVSQRKKGLQKGGFAALLAPLLKVALPVVTNLLGGFAGLGGGR